MELKMFVEEWKDSFRHRGGTIEVFVNPTKKELGGIVREKALNRYSRMIRWAANNETKKVYAWRGVVNHDTTLKIIGATKDVGSFESPHWLTGAILDDRFESDKLSSNVTANRLLKQNWKWAEEYLPGLGEFLKKVKGWFKIK